MNDGALAEFRAKTSVRVSGFNDAGAHGARKRRRVALLSRVAKSERRERARRPCASWASRTDGSHRVSSPVRKGSRSPVRS